MKLAKDGSNIEHSLEPMMKLHLINHQNSPNKLYLRESIFLMNDMLTAVECGHNELLPDAKRRIYGPKGVELRGQASFKIAKQNINYVNPITAKKIMVEKLKKEEQDKKWEEHQKRRAVLAKNYQV